MRIAVVCPLGFGGDGYHGGGERWAYELAKALSKEADVALMFGGLKTWRRREGRLLLLSYRRWGRRRHPSFNPIVFGFLVELAGVDVIHCVGYGSLICDVTVLAARLLRKPCFVTDVGGGTQSLSLSRYVNTLKYARGVIALSRFAVARLPTPHPIAYPVYGGANTDLFQPAPWPRRRSVVYVGRLLPHKGIDYLIQAVAPDIPLVICGRPYDADFYRFLRRLARGQPVEFIDNANDERIASELGRATVAVAASVYADRWGMTYPSTELLGLSTVEAMACGTPCVVTNVASLPEVVADGITGFVVTPQSVPELRNAISRLLADPRLAQQMGQAGFTRVQAEFTWASVARRVFATYRANIS